jgi:transposase
MNQRRTKIYTVEFKESSADLAMTSDQSVAQVARDLGVNENTLHGWIRKHGKKALGSAKSIDLQAENQQLKKENARLKQERDILKKAAAYFANEMA